MCGFILEFADKIISDKNQLDYILTLSTNRGPDKSNFISPSRNTWFGFNRLAIQDLSDAGNQPMLSDDGLLTLVFNGEIYNHLEIRKKLNKRNWRGHSDTETILAAIVEWGFDKTIESLDGMFAIACYNNGDNTLNCARDFAGIKPFFFGWDGHTFVGASQYNQITAHSAFKNSPLDYEVFRLYLEQHFVPAPFGLYKNTGQLEPGEILTVSNGKIQRRRYWELPEHSEFDIRESSDALEIIGQALFTSVESEMMSDVPLGAFLSGGIDSPLIAYYAKQLKHELNTFTIGSDSKIHDETEDALTYSKLIGTSHISQRLDAQNIQDELNRILKCVTEPMADFSVIPTFLVSKFARSKVTVALSGDGGDELFFGYERFWSIAKNIKYQHYPWVVKAAIYGIDKHATKNKRINSVLLSNSQALSHQNLHSRFSKENIESLFPYLKGIQTPDNFRTYDYSNTKSELELIQSMRKAEFYGMMQKTLRKVDLASMGNSLEVRVPFLKKSFIEASQRIDPYLSFGNGRKKEVLKTLLRKNLPESPIDNQKRGFTVPLGKWLQNESFMDTFIGHKAEALKSGFGMNNSAFEKLQRNQISGTHDHKWPLFTITALSY
jgi:asparagine synthase (glutamine-hydrolysing)